MSATAFIENLLKPTGKIGEHLSRMNEDELRLTQGILDNLLKATKDRLEEIRMP